MYRHDLKEVNNLPLSPMQMLSRNSKKNTCKTIFFHGKLVHLSTSNLLQLFFSTNFWSLRILNSGNSPRPTRASSWQNTGVTVGGCYLRRRLVRRGWSNCGANFVHGIRAVEALQSRWPHDSGGFKNNLPFFGGQKKSMRLCRLLLLRCSEDSCKKWWWFLWDIFCKAQLLRKALLLAKAKFEPRELNGQRVAIVTG